MYVSIELRCISAPSQRIHCWSWPEDPGILRTIAAGLMTLKKLSHRPIGPKDESGVPVKKQALWTVERRLGL